MATNAEESTSYPVREVLYSVESRSYRQVQNVDIVGVTGSIPVTPTDISTTYDEVAKLPAGSMNLGDMVWSLSHRADPNARVLADRHYNRQKIGSPQFVPPGRCVVLFARTGTGEAFWITSWPFAEYVKHEWAGAWVCSAFRNEGAGLSSNLIRHAVAARKAVYGAPPPLGMITFVDPKKVRRKRDFGRCYRRAGFRHVGETKGGLLALQLLPEEMPEPQAAMPMLPGPLFFGDAA